jgi:hypothetical protein
VYAKQKYAEGSVAHQDGNTAGAIVICWGRVGGDQEKEIIKQKNCYFTKCHK